MQVLDLRAGRDAEFGVEVRQGFVHQEGVRFADDGAGKGDALALATRQGGGAAVEKGAKLDHLGGFHDAVVVFIGRDAADFQGEADVLIDGEVRV